MDQDVIPEIPEVVAHGAVPDAALDVDGRGTDYKKDIDNNTGIDMYMDWSGRL